MIKNEKKIDLAKKIFSIFFEFAILVNFQIDPILTILTFFCRKVMIPKKIIFEIKIDFAKKNRENSNYERGDSAAGLARCRSPKATEMGELVKN